MTPATAFRVRQWYAAIEQARDLKQISLGCDRYLKRIKGQRTVAQGGYADVRDAVMAGWLGRSRRTIMRYRAEAVRAGLLEDQGTRGLDHKPCMVRPILPDGTVFNDIFVAHSVTKAAHQPAQYLPTENTPQPPAEPIEPAPAPAAAIEPIETLPAAPITFAEVWAASDQAGPMTYAEEIWRRLTDADKAAIAGAIKRDGRLQTGSSWVGKWLKFRRWPTLIAPRTSAEIGFRVDSSSPAGEAWSRYWSGQRLRGQPIGRDGYFIRRLPTLWPPEQ